MEDVHAKLPEQTCGTCGTVHQFEDEGSVGSGVSQGELAAAVENSAPAKDAVHESVSIDHYVVTDTEPAVLNCYQVGLAYVVLDRSCPKRISRVVKGGRVLRELWDGPMMPTMAAKKKSRRDVNQNVSRIFDEMIERSEQPPQRGNMKIAPPPPKKNGATK